MAFKKDLTPINKGPVHKHKGKGSEMAPMPNRNELTSLQKPAGQSINNYAKASPLGQPQPAAGSGIGLGSGDWAGNGM